MSLAVGHITYANCTPLFHYLPDCGFRGRIVPGVPAELNGRLARGEIDVSPSSSFEYGRHWRDYLLLPGHSISSGGAVQSVLLFSSSPLEKLDRAEIALTGESATSVNLLRILFREFLGLSCQAGSPQGKSVEEVVAGGGNGLLIGDRALRAALDPAPGVRAYDLGELWHRFTGLPFVYALWILRRDAARTKAGEVRDLVRQLAISRDRSMADLEALAAAAPESRWLGAERLAAYWRAMSYELTEAHLEGLRLFFRLSVRHGLLPEEPELRFFE